MRRAGSATPCVASSREPSKRSSASPSPRPRRSAAGFTASSRAAHDTSEQRAPQSRAQAGEGGILMEQVEHLAGPPLDGATAVLTLIERVALDPGADVKKLDRIVAM